MQAPGGIPLATHDVHRFLEDPTPSALQAEVEAPGRQVSGLMGYRPTAWW